MLFVQQVNKLKVIAFNHLRQRGRFGFLLIVFPFAVENHESGEDINRAGRPEKVFIFRQAAFGVDIDGGIFKVSLRHLAGYHSLPNQVVYLVLRWIEILFY